MFKVAAIRDLGMSLSYPGTLESIILIVLFLESLILFSRWLFPMLFESSTVKVVFPNLNKYRIYSLVKFLHHLKKSCGFGDMA